MSRDILVLKVPGEKELGPQFQETQRQYSRRAWSQTDLGKLGEIVFCAIPDSS